MGVGKFEYLGGSKIQNIGGGGGGGGGGARGTENWQYSKIMNTIEKDTFRTTFK